MATPSRLVRVERYAVYCDGISGYAKIEPLIVYGWQEITIEELVYSYHPKANTLWSKFSAIGGGPPDHAGTYLHTDWPSAYTYLRVSWSARKPDGTLADYVYEAFEWKNSWMHLVRRFTSTREISFWVNAEKKYFATVPSNYVTVLEQDPNTATYPHRYRRFVLGASSGIWDWMKVSYAHFRVYRRALENDEIEQNCKRPWDPARKDLFVWLYAHPDYIKDIDDDGILEWIDLSGNNNHAKLYGARLVELIKPPARLLPPSRIVYR